MVEPWTKIACKLCNCICVYDFALYKFYNVQYKIQYNFTYTYNSTHTYIHAYV